MKTNISTSCKSTVLITGIAGFIGFHLALYYYRAGYSVIGIDRCIALGLPPINQVRLQKLRERDIYVYLDDITKPEVVSSIVTKHQPALIFHMAANANVRCADAKKFSENIAGIVNVLTAASKHPPQHLLFASSSPVYGINTPHPFCEDAEITKPINPYAKSKFAGEIIAEIWQQGYNLPITGIRFFNVYGPWGRPEMALFRFADSLALGTKTTIISGNTHRSWLFIDDAVQACTALAKKPPLHEDGLRIVNIAGPRLIKTMDALHIIAGLMGKTPDIIYQPPSIKETASNPANTRLLQSITGNSPQTDFNDGVKIFLQWHCNEWMPIIEDLTYLKHGT